MHHQDQEDQVQSMHHQEDQVQSMHHQDQVQSMHCIKIKK